MPKKELYTTVATEIEQKELVAIADPFARVIANADLTDVQIQKREEDWQTIQRYCLLQMEELLQKKGRESTIKSIAEVLDVSPTKVKKTP